VIISLLTKSVKSDAELDGLVYSMTAPLNDSDVVWYQRPWFLALIVAVICIILTILFW
jgi:hypothetical protein